MLTMQEKKHLISVVLNAVSIPLGSVDPLGAARRSVQATIELLAPVITLDKPAEPPKEKGPEPVAPAPIDDVAGL